MSLFVDLAHTHLATTHSTNSQLIDWVSESFNAQRSQNPTHFSKPHLLTADTQTGGRGQHGRTWQSPLGNVYLSLYIPNVKVSDNEAITLKQRLDGRLSLCVGYQISQMPPLANLKKIGVKWVNDIGFYQGEQFNKLAGILIEPVTVDNKSIGLVVGVGMNIEFSPILTAQTQKGLNYQAISLQDLLGKTSMANDFYQPISQAILQAIHQFNSFSDPIHVTAFLQQFRQVDSLFGKQLQITLPTHDILTGTAHGIDCNGCLQLLQADGTILPVWTGTIQVLAGL